MKGLAIGLLVCSLSVVAATQDPDDYNPTDTGNDLRRALSEPAGLRSGVALGYIQGVVNSMEVLYSNQPLSCSADGVTVGQMVDVVKRYLHNHPETRHEPAVILIATAAREAFPCPRDKK
jgi:Ssp1 endopeptidase immunity protein Rap1a